MTMTADQLLNIPEYGTGHALRQAVAHSLSELEAKAALGAGGLVPAGDPLIAFLSDALDKAAALQAVGG